MTTVYTLEVDEYTPEITAITRPLLVRWAAKIGADLHVISTRRWPHLPPVYEKLQIYDLSKQRGDDWSIYVDADALVHPDLYDPTNYIPRDTVMHNGCDNAGNRWRYDDYFRRDGRHIGACNWFTVASSWCRDLWRPLDDLTFEQAVANIFPTREELSTVITPEHLIDDYVLSRNIARFVLKFETLLNLQKRMNDSGNYLWHQYTMETPEKVEQMKVVIVNWKV